MMASLARPESSLAPVPCSDGSVKRRTAIVGVSSSTPSSR